MDLRASENVRGLFRRDATRGTGRPITADVVTTPRLEEYSPLPAVCQVDAARHNPSRVQRSPVINAA
jgi:hypothetical protein